MHRHMLATVLHFCQPDLFFMCGCRSSWGYADNAVAAKRTLIESIPSLGQGLGGPDHGVRQDLLHFEMRVIDTLADTHSLKGNMGCSLVTCSICPALALTTCHLEKARLLCC